MLKRSEPLSLRTVVVGWMLGPAIVSVLSAGNALARDLEVGPGQTFTVTPDIASLQLEHLVLGDAATLRFDPAVTYWNLSARSARIGEGVRIAASGAPGDAGRAGPVPVDVADECRAGAVGSPGEDGQAGGKGINLALQVQVESFGSLIIDTRGGAGGNGGAGGRGQDAGSAGPCEPPAGGAGGNGGRGGRGGDGGNISLGIGLAGGEAGSIAELVQRIEFLTEAGAGGRGGEPGNGGAGARGKYVKRKTLAGNVGWLPGGATGARGAAGGEGVSGSDGRVIVSEISSQANASVRESAVAGPGQADRDAEIEALKAQLELMQKRLQALEK